MSLRISRLQGGLVLAFISVIEFEDRRDNDTLDGDKVYVIDDGTGKGRMYFFAGPGDVVFLDTLEIVPTFPSNPIRDLIYFAKSVSPPQVGLWNGKEPVSENFRVIETPVCTFFQRSNDKKFTVIIEDATDGGGTSGDLIAVWSAINNHAGDMSVHLPTGGTGVQGQVLIRGTGNTWTFMDWPTKQIDQILNFDSSKTGVSLSGIAGVAIKKGQTICIGSSGEFYLATSNTQEECSRYVGVAVNDTIAAAGQPMRVMVDGIVTLSGVSFIPGKPVYLDTVAGLTQDDPAVTPRFGYHFEVGVATSTDTVLLRRGSIIKL